MIVAYLVRLSDFTEIFNMTIYVDADACPVKEIIVNTCKQKNIAVTMVMDFNHIYNDGYSNIITVDKGFDSADFRIVNLLEKGDICVSSDYGLCSMALAKIDSCITFNGLIINTKNIDELLFKRHINKELRKINKKGTHFSKRTSEDNEKFKNSFVKLIQRA